MRTYFNMEYELTKKISNLESKKVTPKDNLFAEQWYERTLEHFNDLLLKLREENGEYSEYEDITKTMPMLYCSDEVVGEDGFGACYNLYFVAKIRYREERYCLVNLFSIEADEDGFLKDNGEIFIDSTFIVPFKIYDEILKNLERTQSKVEDNLKRLEKSRKEDKAKWQKELEQKRIQELKDIKTSTDHLDERERDLIFLLRTLKRGLEIERKDLFDILKSKWGTLFDFRFQEESPDSLVVRYRFFFTNKKGKKSRKTYLLRIFKNVNSKGKLTLKVNTPKKYNNLPLETQFFNNVLTAYIEKDPTYILTRQEIIEKQEKEHAEAMKNLFQDIFRYL